MTAIVSELLNSIEEQEKKLTDVVGGDTISINKYSLGPWSYSKWNMLSKCPYQFYLKYVLKVKNHVPVDTLKADIGTSAHKILEYIMRGQNIQQAYKNGKTSCVPTILTEEQWDTYIAPLEYNIQSFAERIHEFEKKTKIKRVLTEFRVGVNKSWEPTTFFGSDVYYRGIIDLAIQIETPEGLDLLIIDHKHGGGEFNNSTRNYESQLNTYKPLFHFGVDSIQGAQSGVHFIQAGKLLFGKYIPRVEIETNLKNTVEMYLEGACEKVKETKYFKHVAGNHCNWCEYKIECKAGLLKEHEKSTKKRVIPITPV